MTQPTLHKLAGILMLALVTTVLISHPSAGSHPTPAPIEDPASNLRGFTIDGIENAASPSR
jgi:hypothetical protein